MATAYIASPYGFSEATRPFYDGVLLPAVRGAGIEVLDPWADEDRAIARAFADAEGLPAGEERRAAFVAINEQLAIENEKRLLRCDAVLAVLDGVDVDSGVAAEVGFAAALRKPCVGLRLDFRSAGDNEGSVVNLQVEHWLVAVERSVEAAVTRLADVARASR